MSDFEPFYTPGDWNEDDKSEPMTSQDQGNLDGSFLPSSPPQETRGWLLDHWKSLGILALLLFYLFAFSSARKNLSLVFSLMSQKESGQQTKKIKEIALSGKNGDTKGSRATLFSFGPSASVTGDYQDELERALLKAVTMKGKLKRGERVIKALVRNGLSKKEAERVVAAFESKGVFQFRRAQPGNTFVVRMSPEGDKAYYFEYHFGRRITLIATRKRSGFDVRKVIKPLRTRLVGVVMILTKGGLAQAARDADQDPRLAAKLGVLIEDEIPVRRLSPGDRFELLVERKYIGKQPSGYGRILALSMKTRVKGDYDIFYFAQKGRGGGYYTADGLGFFRVFLDRPVEGDAPFDTDPYHADGVIFPAGRGAIVRSMGRGRVKWAGWKKKRGKMVVVEHPGGYETAYYYLSRIAHIKAGDTVEKRTVLGRAGWPVMNPALTGVGFSARHKGRYITPPELARVREESMEPSEFPAFTRAVASYRSLLKPLKKLNTSASVPFAHPVIYGVRPWDRNAKGR